MMAASARMLAISVKVSSLASMPACLAVSLSQLFQPVTLLVASRLSMLTFSNTASKAPAAMPPMNACSLEPPRSMMSFAWLAAAVELPTTSAPVGPKASRFRELSPMLMPV